MSENTRKYYISQGEEFEKASEYEKALASYLEAFSIVEITEDDNKELFEPGFLEDRIAFLAYRLGEYRTALTFGAKAYRSSPDDVRIKNNLPFYTDAIIFTNPKERMDDAISEYLQSNFDSNAKILDVGPYDGRWADRLRACFSNIDAVEAFEPYVEHFNLRPKYNNIFISDIMNFEFDYYDVIIMGDILEHLTVEQSRELIDRIYNKCQQLIIIVPYEYPQDEYDNNEYQIHRQEDLTDEIFKQRYPEFDLMMNDELRGCYIKKNSYDKKEVHLEYPYYLPKTYLVGLTYFDNKQYGLAAGTFSQSLEKMTKAEESLMKYKLGICYRELGKTLEALKAFTNAMELLPSFKSACFEVMKIFEKLEFWADMEHFIKIALENANEDSNIEEDYKDEYWKSLLLIQMTLCLAKQHKDFEAYGYAALALEAPMDKNRRRIAEYNFNELKKELWGTLQINDK